jgi:hypothetical protein
MSKISIHRSRAMSLSHRRRGHTIPIEPDPMNPKTVPSLPGAEPQPQEQPKWNWAEHED